MSYIGREPTPVPLSTADYQDASVTAAKLAPNAAVGNIGYTPFDAAGGTISGAVDINGTTDLVNTNVVGTLDVTGDIDLTGNFIQNPASGTFTLAQDPTLALQAATKQYVDNNFQLATGAIQALTTDLTLTNASARVFEFTSVTEFVLVNLPSATTLSISNGKFIFRNEGAKPFGVRNSTGQLIGAVGPNSTATVYLYDNTIAAGKWSITGDDVRPFYITNSNLLPQSGTAVADTLNTTQYSTTVKLTSTKYVVIHADNTATNQQVIAYAIDTSTRPATIGSRTVLAALSVASGVGVLAPPVIAFRVTDTTLYVANSSSTTSHVVLTVTGVGIAVSNTIAGTFSGSVFMNPVLGELCTWQRISDDMYLMWYPPSAAVIPVQVIKIDGTTIRVSTATNTAIANGTSAQGFTDPRLISYDAGTGVGVVAFCHTQGASPYSLYIEKVEVSKNAPGVAPTITAITNVLVNMGGSTTGTATWGFAVDTANTNFGCVVFLNASLFPTYTAISGLQAGQVLTSGTNSVIISSAAVAAGFSRYGVATNGGTGSAPTAGIIGNSRGLLFDSYGPAAWRFYLMNATSGRFIKIAYTGTLGSFTATLADISIPDGTNTAVSAMCILAGNSSRSKDPGNIGTYPAFVVMNNSAIQPAAGTQGGAKLYLMNDQSNKINLVDTYAPSNFTLCRDNTPTLIGLQTLQTRDGYFAIPVGNTTTATTTQLSFNTYAWFKVGTNGQLRYFGNWQLPIKAVNEVSFTDQYELDDGYIYQLGNGLDFDQVENIHYRRWVEIQTAVVS
jgi:hypothetical protein